MPEKPTCSTPDCERPVYCKGHCQPCYQRAYRQRNATKLAAYRAAHREHRAETWRAWNAANAAARAAYHAAYNESNREANLARYRALHARQYAENAEALRQRSRDFRAKHPDKVREHAIRREQRLKAQFVEKVAKSVLRARDGDDCGICSKPLGPEAGSIDHVLPIWRGGEHSYANTRLVHVLCNKSRGGRDSGAAREALKQSS